MLHVPDVTGLDLTQAALAYAAAGWFVLPTDRLSKHAGSVVGRGWPDKSSQDAEQITAWFTGSAYGLALHVGRSGAVAFDVDRPENLPPLLRDCLIANPTAHQSTRLATPGRGHYLYLQPAGADLGNGKGRLQGAWGEVRGRNGVIMAEPSVHEKQLQGGRYAWDHCGDLAVLPDALLLALTSSVSRRRRPGRVPELVPKSARPHMGRRPAPLGGTLQQLVQAVLDADERNNALFQASCRAGELVARGRLPREVAEAALCAAGQARMRDEDGPSWPRSVAATVTSGLETGMASIRPGFRA